MGDDQRGRRRRSAWADGGRGERQGVEGLSLNLYRHSQAEQGGGDRGLRQTSVSLFDWESSHLLVNAQQFTRSLTHQLRFHGRKPSRLENTSHRGSVPSGDYGAAEGHTMMQ